MTIVIVRCLDPNRDRALPGLIENFTSVKIVAIKKNGEAKT